MCRIGRRLRSHRASEGGAIGEILPFGYEHSNLDPLSGQGTLLVGQFDWGGFLLKSNGGVQRHTQGGQTSPVEHKRRSVLDCETDVSSRCESRS